MLDLAKQLDDLIIDVQMAGASGDNLKNIVEFIETEIDHEAWGITLSLNQWSIFKAFYQLPLTVEEQSFLESLKQSDYPRTTWSNYTEVAYQYLILEVGRRGSKSLSAAVIIAYEFYRLCHLPNPQKYFKVASNTPITILILATTADQAKGTIYSQVCGIFNVIKYFQPLIARKLIKIGAEEITYRNKLLEIKSGNSKSSSQVGYSIILLVMDEMARVEGTSGEGDDEVLNAIALWNNLGASGISFGTHAKRLALSSAWFEGDAIEQLYKQAESNPIYLGFRLCTWQLNPRFHRDNPIIASDYIADPRKAALEYEGIRAGLITGFFDSDEVVQAFKHNSVIDASLVTEGRTNELVVNRIQPYHGSTYGYLDPAVKKDSYAFAFGHKEVDAQGRALIYVDGLLVFKPMAQHKVSIMHVQDLVEQVHQSRHIIQLGVDHHNSAETAERLTKRGIPTQIYPASNKTQVAQYTCTRELMHEGRLYLPMDSKWRNTLQDELCRVVMIKDNKIDHPSTAGSSKDIADAVCGLCWLLLNKPNFNAYQPVILNSARASNTEQYIQQVDKTLTGFSRSYNKFFRRPGR